MARYRTINVNLDRGYRNDLNANFEQIGIDITNLESDLNLIVGGGFIESLEMARDGANAAATYANTEAQYANAQGTYAKNQGDFAKAQGDYASQKGDYADEKAIAADEAAGRANTEATGLEALKIAVVDATQEANTQANRADVAATDAESAAQYANEQGDYAKRMADDIASQSGVTSVNGKSGAVTLNASDVGAETPSGAQVKADTAETNAKNASIPKSEKGVPDGVARLNADGKVVDSEGNEVEGKITSVNGIEPDETGNVELIIPDPDLTVYAKKLELQAHVDDSSIHIKPNERVKLENASSFKTPAAGEEDPNTTTNSLILTRHSNAPFGLIYAYIRTVFYAQTNNASQIATSYTDAARMAFRSVYNGSWTPWVEVVGSKLPPRINVVLAAGWTIHETDRLMYYKDAFGIVHLKGAVRRGSSASAVITTLPVGYRPLNQFYQIAGLGLSDFYFATLTVFTNGDIVFNAPGKEGPLPIDISFRTD